MGWAGIENRGGVTGDVGLGWTENRGGVTGEVGGSGMKTEKYPSDIRRGLKDGRGGRKDGPWRGSCAPAEMGLCQPDKRHRRKRRSGRQPHQRCSELRGDTWVEAPSV